MQNNTKHVLLLLLLIIICALMISFGMPSLYLPLQLCSYSNKLWWLSFEYLFDQLLFLENQTTFKNLETKSHPFQQNKTLTT